MRLRFLLFTITIASVFGSGCSIRVTPPTNPTDPTPVYIVDHGRHASLLLPDGPTTVREFAYGDWEWFAQANEGLFEAFPTLFTPTTGALGRGLAAIPNDAPTIDVVFEGLAVHPLAVESEAARRLAANLNARFQTARDDHHEQALYGMVFVPDDADYHLLNNCNDVMTVWLRELGCEVRGSAIVAKYTIVGQPAD